MAAYLLESICRTLRVACGTAIALLSLLAVGCTGERSQGLAIFISGDTAGWITPCGCASNQSGGLARRGTLVQSAGGQLDTLVLDAGGSASGTTEYHRLKLASILRGLRQMGIAAHNIGASEAELGPDELETLARQTGVRWISANLRNAEDDWSPEPMVQIVRGGVRVAVVGVIDPELVDHPGWEASDPLQAVLSALPPAEADLRIVLAYADEDGLRNLATALPEVDFVVGGPTGQAMSPVPQGPVTVLSATNKGKYLARLTVRHGTNGELEKDARVVEVVSSLSEDPDQLQNLADYYRRLSEEDFSAVEAGLVSPLIRGHEGYEVAGSESCAACHAEDHEIWHHSRHSHAWDVLVAKDAHYDPSCQRCHTTGYGYQGGFSRVAVSQDRVHVGCENCHGPSLAHVRDPSVKTPFVANEQCIRCHDHENSPGFIQDVYWAKIVHGDELDDASAADLIGWQPKGGEK